MVSVLVPIYSVEKYIERCLRSLFEQTYCDVEYIFVNDNSPDNSINILMHVMEDYPHRKSKIKIIHHKINKGLSAARNTAIENATGEFVMHVDSDDYLELDAIEKLVTMQRSTNADIVTGQAIQYIHNGYYIMERPQFTDKTSFINDMIEPTIHHTIWGRLIKKSLYTDNSIFAKEGVNIGEDMQVMSQLAFFSKKPVSIKDVIYYYDNTNMTSYMNSTNNDKYIYRLEQDKASMFVLYDFFKVVDTNYLPKIIQYIKQYNILLMEKYCSVNNKDKYKLLQSELNDISKSFSFKEKLYKSNYYLCKLLTKLINK